MFTQEQLVSLRNVVTDAVTPLIENSEKRLLERMKDGFKRVDEGFDGMDEKIDNVEKILVKRIDAFESIQIDLKTVCDEIKHLSFEYRMISHQLSIAEENNPVLFLRKKKK